MIRTVAIHQPNFMPWLGFFDKWKRSDVFVLLDQVQFIRRSYISGVSILEKGAAARVTVPVHHEGVQDVSISQIRIDQSQWRPDKTLRRLRFSYGRAPHWAGLEEEVFSVFETSQPTLFSLNLGLLEVLGRRLGLSMDTVKLQSDLGGSGQKSELMATLTRSAGGSVYLSGGQRPSADQAQDKVGAAAYNDATIFGAHEVELTYQNYQIRPYPQSSGSDFVPGLSALDALAWLGDEGASSLLSGGADL